MPTAPIKGTTQEFTNILDIRDGVILLADGSACLIIETSAVNFGLLSQKEQEALIFAYAGLLNSLTFPLQLVIRSRRKDISAYLRLLDEAITKEEDLQLKERIRKYKSFISKTVTSSNVLDKKFYLSIPFSTLEMGVKSLAGSVTKRKSLPFPKEYILNKAKTSLLPKADHLIRLLNRLGLHGEQLDTQRLIELFHHIYNPEITGQKPKNEDNYETPLVSIRR